MTQDMSNKIMTRESTQKGRFRCVVKSLRLVVTLLLLMVVGVNTVWGQITPGYYYIANNAAKADGASYSYSSSNPANSFYLCPAIGSYHDNNVDHPYLTTFKTNQDQNSLWKIEAVSGATNCYYLIHYKTGKYLASNATSSTAYDGGTNRRVVHLENKADDSDIYKFYIIDKSGSYQIYPADYRPGGTLTDASGKSLNVKADNWSMYVPQNGLATGIIGVYDYATNNKVNPGSQWKLEPLTSTQPCATPIVKYSGDEINISYPYTSETGITIYYTIDGTDPSTSSSSNASTSFNISASGVVKVRAFAAKSGYVNSDEAVLWGSARPFLIQSKECADYYLVPSGDGNNVNTSSLPGTNMQWTLQNAGASTGGVPYYYLVSNGKKIQSAATLAMNNALEDDNKFCVVENGYDTGDFFLIPISDLSKSAFKTLYKDKKKNYTDGNTGSEYNVTLETLKYYEQSNGLELWRLKACNEGADQKNLFSAPPFSASTDEVMHYYHIESVGNNGYFIVPPSSSDGYAWTSNTSSDYTDNPWIFKVAASDNWLTYYYIINAASGKFMFFNPDNNKTAAQQNVISMKDESDKNTDNEEKFQFIMVRSTTTDACYIVPKGYSYADASHKNFYNNQYFGLWRDDANTDILKTTWSRSATANNVKWTFEPATFAGAWTDPVVTCDLDGHITITNGEEADGATFYYTVNGDTPTGTVSVSNFLYSESPSKPTVSAGITTIKVRTIASGKQPSNVVTKTIVYNPTITLTAPSYTYTGVTQAPISSVDVDATHIDASEYNIAYKKNNETAAFKDAGSYTIELTDAVDGDYIVFGTSNISIAKAPLTATADDKNVTYGDAIPTYTATYTGFVNGETDPGFTTQPTFACDYSATSDVSTSPYTITVSGGEAPNYEISPVNGTLTVSQKEIGLTWSETMTFPYDGSPHAPTATATGTVNDDVITTTVTISAKEGSSLTGEGNAVNAGSYTATTSLTGDKVGNYCLPAGYIQDFTISKVGLTITAKAQEITYGEEPINDGVEYDGFIEGESETTEGMFTGTLDYAYNYLQYGDVGSYEITPSGLLATNYAITFTPGTLTVNQKEIGLTWSETPLVYNGSAQAPTAIATGTVNNDEIEVIVSGAETNAGTDYTATASGLTGTKAGNYKLPDTKTQTFAISQKALGVTAEAKSKTFGDADPALTYTTEGLVEGDELAGGLERAEGENVGTYAINQGTLSNSNYEITYTGANFVINTKSLGDGTNPTENFTIEITEANTEHVVVKQGGNLLKVGTEGTDYDYSITTVGNATTKYYEVTITGANNYTGSFKATFANLVLSKRFGSPDPGGAATFVSNTGDGNFVVPDDMSAYIVTGINNSAGTVEVEQLDNIPEGVPVLLLSTVNTNGFIVKTKEGGTAPQGTNLLKVDDADKDVSTGEIYVLYKGEFVLNAEGTLPAGKVYLQKAGGSQAPARLTIDWGVANGIEEIPFSEPDMQRPDTWYTLEGIKLNGSPAKRGLYLKNGKKTIVK